ncbi:ElaA protein [Cricetibacter osteomyelitidis]|uniref:ElaA protein n=1 Tax=Cricetibacter osteomyelitidis TaxID=1521931 RepID=A0A4R2T4G9_9PAST|nr:GNAT family N-acetyltransferase [Cricetibacter osteomyelitidis]TCP96216.1 ElaA protein [Cricetibacter osteomyelitidis]
MKLQQKTFQNLTALELYKILQLRSAVFVVEQNCVYQDIDNKDLSATHLWLQHDDNIAAYVRLLPAGVSYKNAAIGRVIVAEKYRRQGLAERIMQEAIAVIEQQWQQDCIQLQAQTYLQKFYTELGFLPASEPYLEDGIPHIDMMYRRKPQ